MVFIGIDAGTTNIKAVLFDTLGNELKVSSRPNVVKSEGQQSQQDMNQLFDCVLNVLDEIFTYTNQHKLQVGAMGITGQGEGLWLLDQVGNPVMDAILWNDYQAIDTVTKLKENQRLYEFIKKEVGSFVRPGSTLSLIKWLKDNHPQQYQKTKTIFSCKDWIRYRLTNEIYWELSDASCSCVNLTTKTYAKEVFEALEIEDVINKLPPLKSATDCCGKLQECFKKRFQINYDIPISGGMIDIVSSAVGIGAIHVNDLCVILGTTGMTFSVKSDYEPDLKMNGWEVHLDGKTFIKGMGTMAATPNLDWIISKVFGNQDIDYDQINDVIKDYKPFQSGIIYHPHISNAGERAPFYHAGASASVLGIKEKTTSYDLIHAVLEGISFSIKDCLNNVSLIKRINLTGGGSKNPVWKQILADVLGCEVATSNSQELGAKGAALSSYLMLRSESIAEISQAFCKNSDVIVPNMINYHRYQQLFELYKETQQQMMSFWDKRKKIMEDAHE